MTWICKKKNNRFFIFQTEHARCNRTHTHTKTSSRISLYLGPTLLITLINWIVYLKIQLIAVSFFLFSLLWIEMFKTWTWLIHFLLFANRLWWRTSCSVLLRRATRGEAFVPRFPLEQAVMSTIRAIRASTKPPATSRKRLYSSSYFLGWILKPINMNIQSVKWDSRHNLGVNLLKSDDLPFGKVKVVMFDGTTRRSFSVLRHFQRSSWIRRIIVNS